MSENKIYESAYNRALEWFKRKWRNYIDVDKDGVVRFANFEKDFFEDMNVARKSNPIIDNRIVGSHTYAVRYLSFLSTIYPNVPTPTCSGMDEEEFEYMCYVACSLIKYQVDTCPDSERWYFENLVPDYSSGRDIIEYVCERNPDFLRFLKVIKAY